MKLGKSAGLVGLIVLSFGCESSSEIQEATIVIKGSDTEFELVSDFATVFSEQNDVVISVEGKGSSTGIEKLIEGKVDIANSSREMTDEEIEAAIENGVTPVQAIIATDAIAFISHPSVGVDSLSNIQIKGILSGEIINWEDVGGKNRPIKVYGRNRKSGTFKFIESRFAQDAGFSEKIIQLESNQAIINAVMRDSCAIGYVGAGFLMDENGKPNSEIWAMYLYTEGDRAYSPYEITAVTNGDYPLIRPLYQYFNGAPQGIIKQFLEFELSEEGEKIIQKHGYFNVSSYYESINKKNGILM